jgi:hypothetical protein
MSGPRADGPRASFSAIATALLALFCAPAGAMQGDLFGEPMPANPVRAFLAARDAMAPRLAAAS